MSRILKASILVATATAIGIAIQLVGNPETLFAYLAASAVEKSGRSKTLLEPGTGRSTPTIQSTADAQALPAARDAPARDEIAAASELPSQSLRRKLVSLRLKPCLSSSKLGPTKRCAGAGWVGSVQSVEDVPAQAAKMSDHGRSKAPTCPAGLPYADRDTAGASKKGPAGPKCTGTGRVHTRLHTRPLCAKSRLPRSCRPSVGAT